MLSTRNQENLAFIQQSGAALKQQQGQAKRQLRSKTPGAGRANTPLKVPLNDENAAGGAKSILGARTRGNENALTSKGVKGLRKSNLATPSGTINRAPLGNKTTNAKAKGSRSVNVKTGAREIEKSKTKAPATTRPRQKRPQAESQKIAVHTERLDPPSEGEIEYCPPKPKELPYESDIFPDGALKYDALKPENLFKGYYDYYFNPVDEHGVPLVNKELEKTNKRAVRESQRRVRKNIEKVEWDFQDEPEIDEVPEEMPEEMPKEMPVSTLANTALSTKAVSLSRVPSINRAKRAAEVLSMEDKTNSLRRCNSAPGRPTPPHVSSLKQNDSGTEPQTSDKKTPTEIEANSRTTIGYNKGRSTASILAQETQGPGRPASSAEFTRPDTILSTALGRAFPAPVARADAFPPSRAFPAPVARANGFSPTTAFPAPVAQADAFSPTTASAAAEDREWRAKVPFLAIFNPEDCFDDDDDAASDLVDGSPAKVPSVDENFEFKIIV